MNDREVDQGVRVDWRFAGRLVSDPIILAADLAEMGFPDSNVASRCNRYAMFRGRKPGRGAVLMSKGDFDAIPHPQRCQHSLAITCENTVVIRRLCVTRVEVLAPNILQNAKNEPIGVPRDSPCIVEIADARHYAPMTSIMRSFNWRNVMGRPRTGALNYQLICQAIWFEGLMGLFQLPLEFAIDDPLDLVRLPEQLGFQGMNAWEALWVVLDLAGWSFTLTHDGVPRIFSPKLVSETQDVFNGIQRKIIGRRSRYDTLAEPVHAALPEKIRAVTRQRDFQWYRDPNAESFHSGDMVDRFPMFEFEFDSRELLQDLPLNVDGVGQQINRELIATKEFVPGTKHVVYGTVPYLTNDRAVAVNADAVLADLRFVATRYLRRIARIDQGATWIYSLLWPFFPNSHVSAVGYTDVGGAFTMTVKIGDDEAVEWKGSELSFNAELARPGNPGWRDPVPYGRELYGVLIDHFPSRGQPTETPDENGEDDSPGLDNAHGPTGRLVLAQVQVPPPVIPPDLPAGPHPIPPGGQDPAVADDDDESKIPPLPDRHLGLVAIVSGHVASEVVRTGPSATDQIDQPVVQWVQRDFVLAYNGTGRPLRMNRRVYGKWNYQIGISGAWVIVVGGASPQGGVDKDPELADWAMQCILDSQEVHSAQDPGLIIVDKRRMLRLIIPGDSSGSADLVNPSSIGLSFYNGPRCSILATRDPEDKDCPIIWDDSPCLRNLSVECWIKFGGLEQVDAPFGDLPVDPADPDGGMDPADPDLALNASRHVTWMGPSRLGSLRMRLPPAPTRSHKFLISGPSQGTDTELMWAGPGYSGYMEVKLLDDTPVGLTFEHGLLVASTYPVMRALPKVYGVEFEDCPPTRFNPCGPCDDEESPPAECDVCLEGTGWPRGAKVRVTIQDWPVPNFRFGVDEVTKGLIGKIQPESHQLHKEHLDFVNGDHEFIAVEGCVLVKTATINRHRWKAEFVGDDLVAVPVVVRETLALAIGFQQGDKWWLNFGLGPGRFFAELAIDRFDCQEEREFVLPIDFLEAGNRPRQLGSFSIFWHGFE